MKIRFMKIGRSGLVACMLAIAWTEAWAGERSEPAGGIVHNKDGIMVEDQRRKEIDLYRRRAMHVAEKLRFPNDATLARSLHREILSSMRMEKTRPAEHPDWLDDIMEGSNPVDNREAIKKMMSVARGFIPGGRLVRTFELDEKLIEQSDRVVWNSGCGSSSDCLIWTAREFVNLESRGKVTPDIRKWAADLGVLPTNSPMEEYGELSGWGKTHETKAFLSSDEGVDPGNESEGREGIGAQRDSDLARETKEKLRELGQKFSREDLKKRIAEVSMAQKEEDTGGPLQEYRQRMEARIKREVRADIYASVGTFVSFVDPQAGRLIAVGFPAADRLVGGMKTILSGAVTLAAFGDVLGGAAALTTLLASLGGSEDALARNIRMIQTGLKAVSGQVKTVDRKVDYVMKRLDEVATTTARTHVEVLKLGERMDQIHEETMRQIGGLSMDVDQLTEYLVEDQKDKVETSVNEVEKCVNTDKERMLRHTERNDRASEFLIDEHTKCKEDAFQLAWNLARRKIHTYTPDLEDYFIVRQYDATDAYRVAKHWHEMAEWVVSARLDALKRPTKYRGLFEKGEKQTPELRTAAMELSNELSKIHDGSAINPMIWQKGVELYVKLERHRAPDVPVSDNKTHDLIGSAEQMKDLLKVIEDGNLAYDAMELHLWNGHLLVQVLRGLWSEYLKTKAYRFSTCTEKVFEEARGGADGSGCSVEWPYGWRGNDNLVFEYWSNDYDEERLPTGDPEKIQAMIRLLRANDGTNGVESVERIEEPDIKFSQDVEVVSDQRLGNILVGPGLWWLGNILFGPFLWQKIFGEPIDFPAIYGDVGVSWTGCMKIAVEHRIIGRHPFGTEERRICVGDKPRTRGSVERWRQFVKGGHLKHRFPQSEEIEQVWCYLDGETSILQRATYDGKPMMASWTLNGAAYIRKGSLVLNNIGLTIDWNEPDKLYSNPVLKKDAYKLVRHESNFFRMETWHPKDTNGRRGSCEFHALWGIWFKKGGFFQDTLRIDERYYYPPEIDGYFTEEERREVMDRRGVKNNEAYREHKGAMLLFEPTHKNIAFLEENLAKLIFDQEVGKIFDTVKREMLRDIRSGQPGRGNPDEPESQKTVVDIAKAEYKYATQQTMARFVEWATDEANMRREVDLEWHEVVGLPAPASFRASLEDALHRLDESFVAVQMLSRIVGGTCPSTPGGASFEALTRDLASGKDVMEFLKMKSNAAHESRFPSWTKLRRHGLLGVSSAGLSYARKTLKEDAARLRERVGALDRWPLITEVRPVMYGEGAILLGSLDAAMEIVREAARRSGVVVASENDAQGYELEAVRRTVGRAPVATVSRRELEMELREHEKEITMGTHGIEIAFMNVGQAKGSWRPATKENIVNFGRAEGSWQPATKKNIVATGIPIAWVHADEVASAFDVAVKKVSMTSHEVLEPMGASKVEKQAKENILRQVQNRIGDILGGRMCRPGINVFDDGTKQLESILAHSGG